MTSDIEVAILRLLKMGRGGGDGATCKEICRGGGGYQSTIKLLTNSQELHFLRYPREERVRVP